MSVAVLDLWQQRLAHHFQELASSRRSRVVEPRPVFALEHGLDSSEREALASAIREHSAQYAPASAHSLAWVVYAAEIGYGYSGDEYWQTFEQRTPGWSIRGDRYWIRDRYRWFHIEYGGAEPVGRWAEWFTIICWPITHAILPRDLQRQLARILFDIRHLFSAELFEKQDRLGDLVAAQSWNASSRFQNLAQDSRLVGQIAAALLLQGRFGTENLIHPSALQRISEDLDRERRAREWLRGARRFAQERAKIRGLALGRGVASSTVRLPEEARAEVAALGIEPRLVLRPKASDASRWEVSLEIPDLSSLLLRFPRTRDVLAGSRCVVAGAAGRPLSRGRCLHGAQRVALARWPREDEVLLQFEQTDAQLEYLLRAECLLRPGPCWLFRIASDGLAYESRSLRVRPGERYIVVTSGGQITPSNHARSVDLECEDVRAALLELPDALTSDWENALRSLGLGQAKSVEVWPAGLGAVAWDGEGHGEWLVSERPCLAIRTDHSVATLVVSIETEPGLSLELPSVMPGETIFVQLPQLPVGLHAVRVCTRGSISGEAAPIGDLNVVMRVREARPWSPGVSPQGPLVVQIDPAAPTLEQLWEGRVEISVLGPAGRHVKCAVSLRETESGAATVMKHLPPIPLPLTPDVWRRHFERHFQETREAPLAYDMARFSELEFTCDELGAFTFRCEREFTPLRWAVRRNGQRHVARLLDDSGDASPPQVVRMAFESPLVEDPLDPAEAYEAPTTGGLYVARRKASSSAVIIPPTVRAFADLRCVPRIDARERSTDSVLRAIAAAHTWGGARLPGDLFSATRQRDVLRALTQHIFQLIGGDTWALAELSVCDGPDGLADLKRAISKRREETGISRALCIDCAALSVETCEARVRYLAALTTSNHLLPTAPRSQIPRGDAIVRRGAQGGDGSPAWLSELALRLASGPAMIDEWAGEDLRAGTTRLLEVPTLARAARFLVIATDRHLQSRVTPGELYAGWGWV